MMHTKLILNLASKRNYSSSSNSSNSSLVIRSPDNQNRVVNELQLTQTQPSIQTQTQASANSDINPEQLLNSVSNNPNTKTLSLKDKGKKRPIDEVSSSEDSVVSKKVMESQNSEQSSNNALIPNSDSEQSSNNALIPNSDTNPEEIEHIQNTYITLKSQVRVAMDNIKECREIMEQYKKFEVYVCERRPSSISRNIEFDATFEKHGANYTLPDNRTGLYWPPTSEHNTDGSNVSTIQDWSSHDEGEVDEFFANVAAQEAENNNTQLPNGGGLNIGNVPQNMDYNLVTYLTTPEIRDNPELTTHHLPSTRDYQFSDDTSSSGSVSADVGLEPLNNGATAGDSTYSYVDRIDGNEFGNYLIISEGTDNHDYRMLYEYVIDCLGSLEILTKNFDLALECESFLHRLDIDFSSLGGHEDIHSSTIFQAGQALLAFLSAI